MEYDSMKLPVMNNAIPGTLHLPPRPSFFRRLRNERNTPHELTFMKHHCINLPKEFSGDGLLYACVETARQLGYETHTLDRFREEYELVGARRRKKYTKTDLRVGHLLPAFYVLGLKKEQNQDYFFILQGAPFGFAPRESIERYLTEVGSHLQLRMVL